jgi:hypothetical protein
MEVLFGMIVCAALALVGAALSLKVAFWVVCAVVLPLAWLWMLVDAIARREEDYPSRSRNEKVLWIVLILLVHVSAAVYWFLVYRPARLPAKEVLRPAS